MPSPPTPFPRYRQLATLASNELGLQYYANPVYFASVLRGALSNPPVVDRACQAGGCLVRLPLWVCSPLHVACVSLWLRPLPLWCAGICGGHT